MKIKDSEVKILVKKIGELCDGHDTRVVLQALQLLVQYIREELEPVN